MSSKTRYLVLALWVGALPMNASAAEMVDVTFTVPVQIQNIHANWSKVGVFCVGFFKTVDRGTVPGPNEFRQVAVIDVSAKARQSISQTVTGTIQVRSDSNVWQCMLKLQLVGETSFAYAGKPGLNVRPESAIYEGGNF